MKKFLTVVGCTLVLMAPATPAQAAPKKSNPAWKRICYHATTPLPRYTEPTLPGPWKRLGVIARTSDSITLPIYPQRCGLVHKRRR